jgi:hypothetical protein
MLLISIVAAVILLFLCFTGAADLTGPGIPA